MNPYHTNMIIAVASLLLVAQTQFEVATLKLSPPPEGDRIDINLGRFQNGRFTMHNVTVTDMVQFAWGLSSTEQLTNAPSWNREVRFDIQALTSPETKLEEVRPMLRQLLAERLQLKTRTEDKVIRHLALVSPASKLKPAAEQPPPNPGPQTRGRILHHDLPMVQLATLLSRFERQTILDFTGLKGRYDVQLEWTPENPNDDLSGPPPERPNLFKALQEQLGLKLESRKSPLTVLVIESVSRTPASI